MYTACHALPQGAHTLASGRKAASAKVNADENFNIKRKKIACAFFGGLG